jgi:hypothetical protein
MLPSGSKDMDTQLFFNLLVGLVCTGLGFLLKSLWGAVTDLQNADKDIAEKVNAMEVLVAGEYVKKSDFHQLSDALFKKLDKIEDKIDRKKDKDGS